MQKVSLAADDLFPAAGPEVDVFFPHTDTHGEDVTCSGLVIDQLSALTHFMWEVGGKNKHGDQLQLRFLLERRATSNDQTSESEAVTIATH